MNNKKNILIISTLVLLCFFLWFGFSTDDDNSQTNDGATESLSSSSTFDATETQLDDDALAMLEKETSALFGNIKWPDYIDLMKLVRAGRVNLVAELWKLRRQCKEGISYESCNAMIRQLLKKNYPSTAKKKLRHI